MHIELRVAIEPEPTTAVIPEDIIGMTFEEARDVLEELDLRVRSREEESDQAPAPSCSPSQASGPRYPSARRSRS